MILAGTGLDSFTDPADITVLYPFAGLEWLFVVLGFVLLLGWHVVQMRDENKEYDEALDLYDRVGMARTMNFGTSDRTSTAEDIEAAEAEVGVGQGRESARATTKPGDGARGDRDTTDN
ncbi:MAG: hypothetical protein M3400_02590 [Actinomycetota bacterium]|nr:hypothetical protein [Actinomycetota bacterium]